MKLEHKFSFLVSDAAARYSPLSDIFACGVILYRLLTGLAESRGRAQ